MNAVDMDNRGVIDLLSAMTALAYDDYVNGGILLENSRYEVKKDVIRLIEVYGKPIELYRRTKKTEFNDKVKFYTSAKKYLEGTRLGDYLLQQGDKEIEKGKHRSVRKTVAFNTFEGASE